MAADAKALRATLHEELPEGAPGFLCPSCGCQLKYVGSRPTAPGNDPLDLSDYYDCPEGCGTYEHDRRRHRVRVVE